MVNPEIICLHGLFYLKKKKRRGLHHSPS